jgi:hypothetical protein
MPVICLGGDVQLAAVLASDGLLDAPANTSDLRTCARPDSVRQRLPRRIAADVADFAIVG